MKVIFYNHNKRINSLKLPTSGTEKECVLKDACNILKPRIELKLVDVPTFNYAYIEDFKRYYYVSDWTYYQGLWTCTLSVDVLTSWRTSILATSAYVEYSSSAYDKSIQDQRMMASEEKTYINWEEPTENSIFDTNGCYILSIISSDANGYNGACAVYALSQSDLAEFSEKITAQSFLDGVWESIKNSFNNPFEAIVSCRWIPFSLSSLVGIEKEVVIVYAGSGVNGKLLNANIKQAFFGTAIPIRELTKTYKDAPPFVTGVLYLPFIGTVPLDLSAFYGSEYIYIKIDCDIVNGDIVYSIGPEADFFVSTYSGNFATQIPLSNNMVDTLGMVASTTGIIGGIVTTVRGIMKKDAKLVTKGLGLGGAGAVGEVRSAEVHTQINGALSSRIGVHVQKTIELSLIRSGITDNTPNRGTVIGLPTFRTLLLSTLNGFCQCSGASISAEAFENEIETINNLLDGGVYIE